MNPKGSDIMKRNKAFIITCFIIVIICLSQCSKITTWAVEMYSNYKSARYEYPKAGTYYCAELGMSIVFSKKQQTVVFSNGIEIEFHIDYGGHLIAEDESFIADYLWQQEADEITVKFIKSPNGIIEEGKTFLYIRSN